jgi:hypothetical protein
VKYLVVGVLAALALALVPAASAGLSVSFEVRDVGARLRYDYTLCDRGFTGQGYTVRYQLARPDGAFVLDHPWHYRQSFGCENNFFSVKDAYESGPYFGRLVVVKSDGVSRTTRWQRVRIR